MNELMRLIDRAVTPFGFRVRPAQAHHLLPPAQVADALAAAAADDAWRALDRPGAGAAPVRPDHRLDALTVFVRSCLRRNRNVKERPPPVDAPKHETILRCLASLARAIAELRAAERVAALKVVVLDDRSDPPLRAAVEAVMAHRGEPIELVTPETTGAGGSLHETFRRAAAENALVYVAEDDYLHEPSALVEMVDLYLDLAAKTGRHLILHPQEHIQLYHSYYPSYLFATATRHWRTTSHMTHHLFLHGTVVRDLWPNFDNTRFVGNRKKRRLGAERRTTNRLFATLAGLSPLPPLAVHFQTADLLPPVYDWRPLWDASDLPAGVRARLDASDHP